MRKFILFAGAAALVAAGGAALSRFRSHPAAQQLNIADSVWPGDARAQRVAQGVVFDEATGMKLDVWRPGEPSGPLPVVVFAYGGSWSSGSRDHYGFAARGLAERGFVVLIPDYRLYPDVRFPHFIEDMATAVAWSHDHAIKFGGDPGALFLAGHSAGAYNVTMVALDRQWLGRLGKDTGIVRGVASLAGPFDFHPFDVQAAIDTFGEYHEPDMTQPVNFARADTPPLLLLTGDADRSVRPQNSIALRQAVLASGGDAELIIYGGIDHYQIVMALSRPYRGLAPVLDDIEVFFRRQLND